MRVLVIGGSGYLGSLVLPTLAQQHTLRVFDMRPPADTTLDYHAGSIDDYDALAAAAQGMDAVLYMAMGRKEFDDISAITTNFDVNAKGVYLALYAAYKAGIKHAVYTSSMSVYDGKLLDRYFPDEDMTPDATHFYGFSKLMGEHACRNATRVWGMSVNALRLCFPTAESEWLAKTHLGTPTIATTGDDVARALLGALDYRGAGFQAFMISGDYEQKIMNMSKAKHLLDWEPLARPTLEG